MRGLGRHRHAQADGINTHARAASRAVRWACAIAVGWLSLCAVAAADEIKPGSVEAQNITAAIDLIKSMSIRYTPVVNRLSSYLKDGKFGAKDLGRGVFGETTFTGSINIDSSTVGKGAPNPFDKDREIYQIVQLAKTLFHEETHTHQHDLTEKAFQGKKLEYEAHTKTFEAMSDWLMQTWKELNDKTDKEERARLFQTAWALAKVLDAELGSFIDDHDGFGYPLDKWKALKKQTGAVAEKFQPAHLKLLKDDKLELGEIPETIDAFDKFEQQKLGWHVPMKHMKRAKPPEPPAPPSRGTPVGLPSGSSAAQVGSPSPAAAARSSAIIDNSVANHLGIVRDRVIMHSMPPAGDARGRP